MTNFDFLKNETQFEPFADTAIFAEQIFHLNADMCIVGCRRAMEFAVKWLYTVDASLREPYDKSLVSLINNEEFRGLVGHDIWKRMDYIRKTGNKATHTSKKYTEEQAELCLENLFIFLDFVAHCYAADHAAKEYDKTLLQKQPEKFYRGLPAVRTELLLPERNKQLKPMFTERRKERQATYSPKPLELTEFETRRLYIDKTLADAGWIRGQNWLEEYELCGMPNASGAGFADYVLLGDDGKALAVIEAKRTCKDVAAGRQQAKLYADLLEKKFGRRPVIFLTNGFETRISDNVYPEREVAAVYSKRDLEKLFNLRTLRTGLKNITVNKKIAGRYYQEGAVKAVCRSFDEHNRRKALLVMATGSGKTRTVIALCDVLLRHGWVKNVLFLADRNALVTQAKRAFTANLPDLSVTNLCEDKENYNAHCVLSTYQTMMHCIDEVKDDEGQFFSVGHFDLIVCDEAHRSIYNKYRDIFTYFDAPLVGLTATPKDEIEKNTYSQFELDNGVPTYGYELAQAVKDGYLVDFLSVETKLKFIEQGIVYDDLSEEDKRAYEDTFAKEDGEVPERIDSSALNEWIFNEDTIRQALRILMNTGLKIDYGQTIGKTIIFAKNHKHAEKILEVFGKEYPRLNGYAKVIDNLTAYSQSAIDDFSDANKLPQIAISVDMLDTGIDVPEILNLVFFKKIMSKAKFWQMIGRGTRLCRNLIDGEDKSKFYIFDFCGNFEFFRVAQGKPTANQVAVQSAIFDLKFQMAMKLQAIEYQTKELIAFRQSLVADMLRKVRELDKENFAVKQHLRYVEKYSGENGYNAISYEDTLTVRDELAPLIVPDDDDFKAVRFDALMYGIELAHLSGKKYARAFGDLLKKVNAIAGIANIPEVMVQAELINKILRADYLRNAGIDEFEEIRANLRDLIKYIPLSRLRFDTNFDDEILSMEWNAADLENDDLNNYKAKAEFYIREHQNDEAIAKLKSNVPLTADDVGRLEEILWREIGSKEDYEEACGQKPLGVFVREIVGLDMTAAKEAFAVYLNDANLDARQIYFVNQIVEYIVHNGTMSDLSVLREPPFTDRGSIVDVFTDLSVWHGIRRVIEQVNANAQAA